MSSTGRSLGGSRNDPYEARSLLRSRPDQAQYLPRRRASILALNDQQDGQADGWLASALYERVGNGLPPIPLPVTLRGARRPVRPRNAGLASRGKPGKAAETAK